MRSVRTGRGLESTGRSARRKSLQTLHAAAVLTAPAPRSLGSNSSVGSSDLNVLASRSWLHNARRTGGGQTGGSMPKVQPPELKGFMDKKLSSEPPVPLPLCPLARRSATFLLLLRVDPA